MPQKMLSTSRHFSPMKMKLASAAMSVRTGQLSNPRRQNYGDVDLDSTSENYAQWSVITIRGKYFLKVVKSGVNWRFHL
jgi:hypothetical protein